MLRIKGITSFSDTPAQGGTFALWDLLPTRNDKGRIYLMVIVVCIGMYNESGVFVSRNWKEATQWLESVSDSLVLYSRIEYKKLRKIFNKSCHIELMDSIDNDLDVKAFKLSKLKVEFWEIIKNTDYCINNYTLFSHMYFFCEKEIICSLEISDFENYLVINDAISSILDMKNIISDVDWNIEICFKNRSDIENLVEGESWKPYGYI